MSNEHINTAVIGSDGRSYTVEAERKPYGDVHLRINVGSILLPYNDYLSYRGDINKDSVEHYISNVRDQYKPSWEKLHYIRKQLTTATINNHFDYLALLQRINPTLEELMQ